MTGPLIIMAPNYERGLSWWKQNGYRWPFVRRRPTIVTPVSGASAIHGYRNGTAIFLGGMWEVESDLARWHPVMRQILTLQGFTLVPARALDWDEAVSLALLPLIYEEYA